MEHKVNLDILKLPPAPQNVQLAEVVLGVIDYEIKRFEKQGKSVEHLKSAKVYCVQLLHNLKG